MSPSIGTAAAVSSLTRMNSTVKDLFIYLYDLSPLDMSILFLLIKDKKTNNLRTHFSYNK
jgi:predicted transcriptional regulator